MGILAAIALPSYRDYIIRSRIAEATSALAAKRVRMEAFYDNNRTYARGWARRWPGSATGASSSSPTPRS